MSATATRRRMPAGPAEQRSSSGRGITDVRRAGCRLLGVGLIGLALVATACGDDEAGATVPTTAVSESGPADAPTVTVRAVDFAFQDLPVSVDAGTRFTLDNTAASELHEMVAIPIAADETRPIGQLVAEDLEALLASAPPAFVLLDPPGEAEPIVAVGDGTLTAPGRYALVCMIPTGVDPAVFLEAAAQSNGGPPQVEGGPPHVAHGMFAEITVTG